MTTDPALAETGLAPETMPVLIGTRASPMRVRSRPTTSLPAGHHARPRGASCRPVTASCMTSRPGERRSSPRRQ